MERKKLLKRVSFILKMLTVISSLTGVLLGLFLAERDGYSHWGTRLMYFTGLTRNESYLSGTDSIKGLLKSYKNKKITGISSDYLF